jgi:hypothetical protein
MELSGTVTFVSDSRPPVRYGVKGTFMWILLRVHNLNHKYVNCIRGLRIPSLKALRDAFSLPTTGQVTGRTNSGDPLLHMMTCMNDGRFGRILYQDRIEHSTTDRQLFRFLKNQYILHRGKFKARLSLKGVRGIYFVKVCDSKSVPTYRH